jgi:hypothetical protein
VRARRQAVDHWDEMPGMYFDREGRPIPLLEWAALWEDHQGRRIGWTELEDGSTISTVWMGMSLGFTWKGPPLIFETMAFGGPLDGEQWRYATEAEARAGHEEAVALARTALDLGSLTVDPPED